MLGRWQRAIDSPQCEPTDESSPSDLREKLTKGLEATLSQIPPQYRGMARSLLPRLTTSLQSASDEKLRGALTQIRNIIDGLLGEGDEPQGPGA